MKFQYRWQHTPTGKTGIRTLTDADKKLNRVYTLDEFHNCIDNWNRQYTGVWIYTALV